MAKRSPILGYNHNIGHRGLVFHVQTEDSGVDNPHIFTHLFHGGVILSSRKLDYDASADDSVVKSLMQAQHKAVLKDLKRGSFDPKIDSYLGHHPELRPAGSGPASAADAAVAAVPVPDLVAEDDQTDPEMRANMGADTVDLEIELDIEPDLVEPAVDAIMVPSAPTEPLPMVAGARSRPLSQQPRTQPMGPMGSRRGTPITPAPPPVIKNLAGARDARRLMRRDTVEIHAPALPWDGYEDAADPAPQSGQKGQAGRAGKPPPIPGDRRPHDAPVPARAGKVVVSRPPIVVDPRKPPSGPVPAAPSSRMANPPRTAREDGQDSFLDQNLISERSLDDVILAYLSEDVGED